MSRNISAALKAHLLGGTLTTATCIRIVRSDGVKLGFNTTDIQFDYTMITNTDSFGSTTYYPVGGVDPNSVRSTSETGVDNLDVMGLLTSDKLTEGDLIAGRYDDADVTIFTVNYNDLSMGEMVDFRGYVGELTKTDDVWKAELLSQKAKLKRAWGDKTSATCRCLRFGDYCCKFNVASVTFARVIGTVTDPLHLTFTDAHATGYYNYGWMKSTGGNNLNLEKEIKIHVNASGIAQITLKENFPFPISPGDTFNVTMGCDHNFSTCKALGNANNFRGEPYLPGTDVYVKVGR